MVTIEENLKQKIKRKAELKSKFILMVDDDPLTNFINRKLLTYMGANANIQTFENGIDALESIENLNASGAPVSELVILLDLRMVEMDGIEFLERLKRMDLCIKSRIYLVSGSMPVTQLQQLKTFSLAGFFLKPLTKGNVREILMPEQLVYFND